VHADAWNRVIVALKEPTQCNEMPATHAPMPFPMVTGMRCLAMKSPTVTSAPSIILAQQHARSADV
jgi:hypothetical protein